MKTTDFIREHHACREGAEWALSISDDMAAVWDALVAHGKQDWLLWAATRPNVFPDSVMRKLACRFVRETPIGGGTVWDKLTDDRSRKAIEVAEAYADGNATTDELAAAYAAASYVADAADAAAESDAYAERATYFAAAAVAAAAHSAAYAADSARSAASASASASAWAVDVAVYFSADAAESALAPAQSAQIKMIAALGNPFKKGADK